LNIAIRTALISGDKITVASGGAIIALSETEKELEEVSLKARAVTTALGYQIISEEEEEKAIYSKEEAVVSGLRA
jgi:para-aminobenzoate synthetase